MSSLTANERIACKAFVRIAFGTRKEQIEREKFEAADRMFDGGEWSGEFQTRRAEERCDRAAEYVGIRFGMTPQQIASALYHWENETSDRCVQAINERNAEREMWRLNHILQLGEMERGFRRGDELLIIMIG